MPYMVGDISLLVCFFRMEAIEIHIQTMPLSEKRRKVMHHIYLDDSAIDDGITSKISVIDEIQMEI